MNSVFQIIKLQPDPTALYFWANKKGLLVPQSDDLSYALHAWIEALFGPHAPRPFRWIEHPVQPTLYGYTCANKESIEQFLSTQRDAEAWNVLGSSNYHLKEMPQVWQTRQRLGFEIRVRPTIRQDRDGDRNKSRERDAFLTACECASPATQVDRLAVYEEWLAKRLSPAVSLVEGSTQLFSFQLIKSARRGCADLTGKRPLKYLTGPNAVMKGDFIVEDPIGFQELLRHGVGRHCTFGFGMLLLSLPSQV